MDNNITNKDKFLFHLKEMTHFFTLFSVETFDDRSELLDLSISYQVFLEEISKSLKIPYSVLLKFIYLGDDFNGKI